MRRHLAVAALLAAAAASPLHAQWSSSFTAERSAQLDASGVRLIRVEARAGRLTITGRSGRAGIDVRGLARANEARFLRDIQLTAQRRGDEVLIVVEMPDMEWHGFRNVERVLDLTIDVPAGIRLDITDTSGDVEIYGTGGVVIDDNSGSVIIERVTGDVRVHDGSGDVEIRDVGGSVTITSDGSGGLDISDVRGSVTVDEDGSGDISARRVAGSFVVRRDGSGAIRHSGIEGGVELPARYSRSRNARVRVSTIRM
jgi:hypothetical protein